MATSNLNFWRCLQVQVFDLAAFLATVHEKYVGTNGGATMEALQRQWDATLAMPATGDASVYPYQSGVPRFALVEVWLKAGDFWRAGYRHGDKLLCDQHGHALYPWMLELIGDGAAEPSAKPEETFRTEPQQLELF